MTAINLPEDWSFKALRDLATINYGKSPKAILSDDGDIPVVGTGGVERYGSAFLYDNESIILGRKGTIDKVGYVDGKFWTIDTAYFLSDFQDAIVKWLFYFLQTVDFRIMNEATGVPSLSRELLYKIEIPTPKTEEQAQIASILSTLDYAIEQTETIIAKQQRIKTGLMQDLLTKGIDEHGIIRTEATHEFKSSPLGRIPVEWGNAKIGDVLTEKPKNGYSPKEVDGWTGTLMLGLGCLSTDGFRPVQLKNAPLDDLRLSNALLKDGDFLISRSNTRDLVGLVGIFKEIGVPCTYPDLMVRLRFDSSVNTKFMEFIFRHHLLRSQLTNSAVGTSGSMVKINAEVITTSCFFKPNIEEQERIVRLLEQMASEICELQKYTSKLNSIKFGVMHDLLTGTVRVAKQ